MTKPLSPAAQAIKDAALSQYADCNVRRMAWPLDMPVVAAAIRAAADQVVPITDDPEWFSRNCCERSVEIERNCVLAELLAIAAELEKQL